MQQNLTNMQTIDKIQNYLKHKSITKLVVDLKLSQSIIYKYRNDKASLMNAKYSTICDIYNYIMREQRKEADKD